MLGGGSPNRGNRRRRLIDTIVPKNKNDPYRSIHSFSSAPSLVPTGFAPVDPDEEQHGYRINVARDGSMITAVPIDKQQQSLGAQSLATKASFVHPFKVKWG